MPKEQIIMGTVIAVLCLNGLWIEQKILTQTKTGERFIRWFGEPSALWVLRVLLMAGAVLGMFLATNVIRPVKW